MKSGLEHSKEKRQEKFEQALHAIIDTWPITNLAVELSSAGRSTPTKITDMKEFLEGYFDDEETKRVSDVIDFLDDYVKFDLNLVVEDDSISKMSILLVQLWSKCVEEGNYEDAETIIEASKEVAKDKERIKCDHTSKTCTHKEKKEETKEEKDSTTDIKPEEETKKELPEEPAVKLTDEEKKDGWGVVKKKKGRGRKPRKLKTAPVKKPEFAK